MVSVGGRRARSRGVFGRQHRLTTPFAEPQGVPPSARRFVLAYSGVAALIGGGIRFAAMLSITSDQP